MRDKIDFDHKGIGDVLSQIRLRVPLNQREYSWELEHVEDLFRDLAGAIANDKAHFLGTIVLTEGDDGIPEVSDGQQRLATTSILLAAIRDWFFRKGENQQADSIEYDFLRRFERKENAVVQRLRLNVDDNDFFSRYVLPNPGDPARRSVNPSKQSHELIVNAANLAKRHVVEIVQPYSEAMQKDVLVRWVNFISSNAQIIVLRVPDDVDAFLMFETLNDRGLKASQADLLKNYLLSQARSRGVEAQQMWAQMTGVLQSLGQDDVTVAYLHHLLITQLGPIHSAEIFDRVKSTVSGESSALRFLIDAAEGANDYAALFNSDHSKWNTYGTSTRKHISTINRDLRVQQIHPLMLAIARKFTPREAEKAFRLCVFWSVRFLVAGGRGGLLDRNYSLAAADVGSQRITTAKQLTDSLSGIIPSDALFETAFSEARVSSAFLARYYLRALEKTAQGQSEPEWIPSDDENVVNLEHVLPESPQEHWSHIAAETASAYYRRLGNMVLMQATRNSKIGASSFTDKTSVLKESSFLLTAEVADYIDWGPPQIEERQRRLAELAVKTWPSRLR